MVEVTCRTANGRFVFEPTCGLEERILGILGRGQRLSGIGIHAFVFMSNHYHLLLSARDALQLARFMGFVNSNLTRAIHRLRGESGPMWGRRYSMSLVSAEPEAQLERMRYLLRQGVKEGLVADPFAWRGPASWKATAEGACLKGQWVDHTRLGRDRRDRASVSAEEGYLSEEIVELSPLPVWEELSPEGQRAQFLALVEVVRKEAIQPPKDREESIATAVTSASGEVLVVSVPSPPKRLGSPLVHAVTRAVRKLYQAAYRAFYAAYRRAAEALRRGMREVKFPAGCFPPPAPFESVGAT